MNYNNTTSKNGILQDCERYCNLGSTGITGDSTLLYDFAAYSNSTLRSLWHLSFKLCGNWTYDDNNQTDLPQATTDLTDGQATYSVPTGALTIKRFEMKDPAGNWVKLIPLALKEIPGAVDEFRKEDSQPQYYRVVGNTVELFPASNYDSTAGLKMYFDRGSVAFAYDDTTATPGFASEYHDLVPMGASLKWMKIKSPSDAGTIQLEKDYAKREQEYKEYLSGRFRDKNPRVGRVYTSFK